MGLPVGKQSTIQDLSLESRGGPLLLYYIARFCPLSDYITFNKSMYIGEIALFTGPPRKNPCC